METTRDRDLQRGPDSEGRFELTEMHLFDADASEKEALCGADTSADCRRSMGGYLEDRLNEIGVGTACEGCKGRAVPFAVNLARDLGAEGLLDEAQEYRELAETLARETGQERSGDQVARPSTSICGHFRIRGIPVADSLIVHVRRSSLAQADELVWAVLVEELATIAPELPYVTPDWEPQITQR